MPMTHSVPVGTSCLRLSLGLCRETSVALASLGLLHPPPGSALPFVLGMCQVISPWPSHGRLTCSDPLVRLDPALISLAEWKKACALTLCDTVKQRLNDKVKHLKTSTITVQWYFHQAPSQTKHMLGKQNRLLHGTLRAAEHLCSVCFCPHSFQTALCNYRPRG